MAIDLSHEPDFEIGGLQVRPSLRKILAGDDVRTIQPRIMQVLVVLARAGGDVVSRDDLVSQCWGGAVVTDDALNRVTSKLRGLLRELDATAQIETIPRVGYKLEFDGPSPASGSANLDWRSRARQALANPKWRVGAPIALGVIALVSATIAILAAVDDRASAAVSGGQYRSIAVLPFDDLSRDAELDYLAVGAAEEVRNALASADPRLRISARASSRSLEAANLSPAEIANILHVDALLDGSVTDMNERTRLSLTLLDPGSGHALWNRTFDLSVDSLDDVRVAAVSEVLRAIDLDPQRRPIDENAPILSAQASEQFLKANYYLSRGDTKSVSRATDLYLEVLDTHPNFASAYTQLVSASLSSLHVWNHGAARTYLDRAIELDPWSRATLLAEQLFNDHLRADGMSEEWLSRPGEPRREQALDYGARLRTLVIQSKYREAEALGAEILQHDPIGVETNVYLARVLNRRGKPQQALERIDQALRYHPGSLQLRFWRVNALAEQSAFDAGVDELVSMLEDAPEDARTRHFLSLLLGEFGFRDEAMALAEVPVLRLQALHAAGETDALSALIAAELVKSPPSVERARMYLLRHDLSAARPWLMRLYQRDEHSHFVEHPSDYKPYLSLALRQAGDEETADRLDAEILAEIERQISDGDQSLVLFLPYKAFAAAARDDRATLYELLDQAAVNGYTLFGLDDVIFDHLRDDPAFIAHEARFREIRQSQHERALKGGYIERVRAVLARGSDSQL